MTIGEEIKQRRPFASRSQEALVALLRTASLLEHHTERLAKPGGLTQQQFNVLRILRGAGKPMPTMDIADRLVQPTPGVTRLLSRLESAGHIDRMPCAADRRQILVTITEAGLAALQKTDPLIAQVDESLQAVLDDDELAELVGMLDRVRHRLRTLAD